MVTDKGDDFGEKNGSDAHIARLGQIAKTATAPRSLSLRAPASAPCVGAEVSNVQKSPHLELGGSGGAVLRGWRRVLAAAAKEFGEDHIPTAAAAVTFYILLSLFPALGAFVSLYGLIADIADAQRQVAALGGFLPGGAVQVLGEQMTRLAAADHGNLGLAFAASLLVSLWSSTSGVKALMEGLNVAYEARERRGFFHLNIVALIFTLTGIAGAIVAIGAVAGAPAVLDRCRPGRPASAGPSQVAGFLRLHVPAAVGAVSLRALARTHALAMGDAGRRGGGVRLDGDVGAVLLVRRQLRSIRQDLRLPGRHRRFPDLDLALTDGGAFRRGTECRDRTASLRPPLSDRRFGA
jgi:hypothetical protein